MSPTICPGQDTRYWNPTDVFDVQCAECGSEIEFFKDDAQRRCRKCGARVINPKLSLGCAQWCEHAEKCLGYDPKKALPAEHGQARALTDRIVDILKNDKAQADEVLPLPIATLEWAEELMKTEGGDPRIILTTSLLVNSGLETAGKILGELGLPADVRDEILGLVKIISDGTIGNTTEAKVSSDAYRLAAMGHNGQPMGQTSDIDSTFATESARQVARQAPGGNTQPSTTLK